MAPFLGKQAELYANNNNTVQPVHPRSLDSAIVIILL